jgi:4-hydroxybenzoate polyprenyltransferase
VLFWVAGFDILYALQDLEFDKAHGLHSAPVHFGPMRALKISRWCHVAAVTGLILFGIAAQLGVVYWAGVVVTAVLLKIEHVLIGDGDLTRIDTVFFTINGWIGILLLIFTFLEIYR